MIILSENESEGFLIYAFNKSVGFNEEESSDTVIHDFMKNYILDTDMKIENYLENEDEIKDDYLENE